MSPHLECCAVMPGNAEGRVCFKHFITYLSVGFYVAATSISSIKTLRMPIRANMDAREGQYGLR